MSDWIVKNEKKPREKVKEDKYYAVCIGMTDIGTQPAWKVGDKPQRQIVFEFELHNLKTGEAIFLKDGSVATICAWTTKTLNRTQAGKKPNFRRYIEALLACSFTDEECREGINIGGALGGVIQVEVEATVNDKGEPTGGQKINTFMSVNDEVAHKIEKLTELSTYDYNLKPGKPIPDSVPEWLQRKIQGSKEWTQRPDDGEGSSAGPRTRGRSNRAAPTEDEEERAATQEEGSSDEEPAVAPAPAPAPAPRRSRAASSGGATAAPARGRSRSAAQKDEEENGDLPW